MVQFKRFRKKVRKAIRKPKRVWNSRPRGGLNRADFSTKFRLDPVYIENASLAALRGSTMFQLSQCPNFSSWTTLFDQYRINKIVHKFVPVLTTVVNRPYDDTTSGVSSTPTPRLTCVVDRDDINIPADFMEVFGRPKARTVQGTKPLTMVFKPNRLVMIYRTGATTGYKVDTQFKEFLDCANSDIPHFGLKYVLEAASPTAAFQYRMETTYYVSFKNRRY